MAEAEDRCIQQIIEQSQQTPLGFLPNTRIPHNVLWMPTPTGKYTTKSAWNALRSAVHGPLVPDSGVQA